MICRISPPCMSKNCTDSLRDVEWAGKFPMDIRQSGLFSVCKAAPRGAENNIGMYPMNGRRD